MCALNKMRISEVMVPTVMCVLFLCVTVSINGQTTTTTTDASTTVAATTTTAATTTGATTVSTTAGTTTTQPPVTPSPTTKKPGYTAAPQGTSTTATTTTPAPTPVPTTTQAASFEDTWTEVDVFFDTFFDAQVQNYIDLFKDMAGVPATRIEVLEYQGFKSAVTGEGYLMSLRVKQATPPGPPWAEDVSRQLERNLNGNADPQRRNEKYGITRAARVGRDKRLTEDNTAGINWLFVSMWLLTVLLMVISLAALFRKRSVETVEEVVETGGASGANIPKDDAGVARAKLDKLVAVSERKRMVREATRVEEIRYAPKPELFACTLEYENRVKLPPEGGLRRARRAGERNDLEENMLSVSPDRHDRAAHAARVANVCSHAGAVGARRV